MTFRWLNRRVAKPGPYLTLVLSEKELDAAVKRLTKEKLRFPTTGAICFTLENPNGDLCAVVALSCNVQDHCAAIEIAGLLIHEAVHVWQAYAADSIQEHHPSSEQEAYAIQGISQELLAEYARRITK
jgi:hypothetical protein